MRREGSAPGISLGAGRVERGRQRSVFGPRDELVALRELVDRVRRVGFGHKKHLPEEVFAQYVPPRHFRGPFAINWLARLLIAL